MQKSTYFRINFRGISTHAKLEIKSIQSACESLLPRYEKRVLKIICLHLNIGEKTQQFTYIYFISTFVVKPLYKLLSVRIITLGYIQKHMHNIQCKSRRGYRLAGDGSPEQEMS